MFDPSSHFSFSIITGGSKYGVFTDLGGVAMLSDKVPATLGSGGNVTRNGGVIIQGGKFI